MRTAIALTLAQAADQAALSPASAAVMFAILIARGACARLAASA